MRIQYNRTKLYSIFDAVSNYDIVVTLPSFNKEVDRTINKKDELILHIASLIFVKLLILILFNKLFVCVISSLI